MSRDQLSRRCRRLLERLSQPSSAAGLAALLALLVPQLAEYAPAIVDLGLTVIAVGAARRRNGQVRMSGLQRSMTTTIQASRLVALADRIELWPIDHLRPYERNPRTHSDGQVDQIAASMVEFGWTIPILIDENAGILAGHGRLLAARKLGLADARR